MERNSTRAHVRRPSGVPEADAVQVITGIVHGSPLAAPPDPGEARLDRLARQPGRHPTGMEEPMWAPVSIALFIGLVGNLARDHAGTAVPFGIALVAVLAFVLRRRARPSAE